MASEYPHLLCDNLIEDYSTVKWYNSSNTLQTEDTVYRLTHLTDRSRLSPWKGAVSGGEHRIVWDMGSGTTIECDCFILDSGFTLTGATYVYLDYSANGSSWTEETDARITSPDADVVYWKAFDTARDYRYWRMRIVSLTAQPVVFNVWLGKRIQLTFNPSGDFDPYAEEIVGQNVYGATGGYQRVHRYRRKMLRADFQNLTDTEVDLLMGTDSIGGWWTQAGRNGLNWWWLTLPTTYAGDSTNTIYFPLYLNCEGLARRFSYSVSASSSHRSGSIEAGEVK